MSTQDIVQKLWNLCNVLRDDGITYHQYVTELTYILFLKMLDETGEENTLKADMLKAYQNSLEQYARRKGKAVEQLTEEEKESRKPLLYNYSWEYLTTLEGIELKNYYMKLLSELGSTGIPKISDIYAKAVSSIEEPKNLQKIISEINKLDWFEAKQEGLGDLYEGLLQKNADEKKSGAGQYFTPRVLIDVMTDLISPKLGEKCFDPACGTFGFMISAYQHAIDGVDLYSLSDQEMAAFQDSFYGVELVHDAHRLALMNAYLHNVPAHISCEDSLAPSAKRLKGFDVILTNPPFGTKKGGERTSRDDISYLTDFIDYRFTDLLRRGFMYSSNGKSYFQITNIDSVNIDSIAILEFFEKLYSLFETRFEVTVTQGESNVKCSEMSEGQRQLIKILGMLGICKTEDCLVLMDEPDAYMNPRWKYEIKETMDNSLRDAINTQAIVATHDPLVINGVPKEFIRIFTHNENLVSNNGYYFTKVIVPTEDTEGMGIDGLLQSEYYGLSSVLDSETKDKMDEKHRLLIKKKDGTITDNEKYKLLELTNDLENMSFTRNIPTDSYYDEYVAAMHKIYSERPHVNLSAEDIAERNAKAEEILKGLLEK